MDNKKRYKKLYIFFLILGLAGILNIFYQGYLSYLISLPLKSLVSEGAFAGIVGTIRTLLDLSLLYLVLALIFYTKSKNKKQAE